MPDLIFHGTKSQLYREIRRLVRVLSGKEPDPNRLTEGLLTRMGLTLLGKIQDAYVEKSEGRADQMGIQWPPLSPVTLALRNRSSSGPKMVEKMQRALASISNQRRTLIAIHYERLKALYTAEEHRSDWMLGKFLSRHGASARKHARFLLEKMQPYISKTRYEKLKKDLAGPHKADRAHRMALVGAFAMILRDTGRLLNSLSPQINSPDREMRVMPGSIGVGSNVFYFKFHDSDRPRKLKKDGTPKLPRRQILPDRQHPMPSSWWSDIGATMANGLQTRELWLRHLGNRARAA